MTMQENPVLRMVQKAVLEDQAVLRARMLSTSGPKLARSTYRPAPLPLLWEDGRPITELNVDADISVLWTWLDRGMEAGIYDRKDVDYELGEGGAPSGRVTVTFGGVKVHFNPIGDPS